MQLAKTALKSMLTTSKASHHLANLTLRPDLVMVLVGLYYVFVLTVYLEANLIKSNKYETKKCDDLCRKVINKRVKLELFFYRNLLCWLYQQ